MTQQISDTLHYRGESLPLHCCPLFRYPWPEHGRPRFRASSTANWRGHVAEWRMDRDELLLVGIDATIDTGNDTLGRSRRVGMSALFPTGGEPVTCEWYTGVLSVPRGPAVRQFHAGFGHDPARMEYVTVVAGRFALAEMTDHATGESLAVEWGDRPPVIAADEWGFLRALRDDDSVRMVYADWLDERGRDGQAAFLRRFSRSCRRTRHDLDPFHDAKDPLVGEAWLALAGYHEPMPPW